MQTGFRQPQARESQARLGAARSVLVVSECENTNRLFGIFLLIAISKSINGNMGTNSYLFVSDC